MKTMKMELSGLRPPFDSSCLCDQFLCSHTDLRFFVTRFVVSQPKRLSQQKLAGPPDADWRRC